MKSLFSICVVVGLSMISVSAFATHAYRSETCTSVSHNLKYNGNYPIGGSYGLSQLNKEDVVEVWNSEDAPSTTDNQFEVTKSEILSSTVNAPACTTSGVDFEETVSKKSLEIKFTKISTADELLSGVTSGTVMTFQCDETFSVPVECANK